MANRYDPIEHKYYIDEINVPGHTDLLPKPTFMADPEILEAARQEGSENHSMIKMYLDTGELFNNPMLIALEKFLLEHEKEFGKLICYEKPLYSKQLMFAGTPDIIFENAIIDWKRQPGNSKIHALQIAGQYILADHEKLLIKKWERMKGYIAWYDGEQFKKREVINHNHNAIDIYKALIKKYYIDLAVKNYLKGV